MKNIKNVFLRLFFCIRCHGKKHPVRSTILKESLHFVHSLFQLDMHRRKQDEIEKLEAEEARERAKKLEEWVRGLFTFAIMLNMYIWM